jgi:hypothetical protein
MRRTDVDRLSQVGARAWGEGSSGDKRADVAARRDGFAMALRQPSPKIGRNIGKSMFPFDAELDRTYGCAFGPYPSDIEDSFACLLSITD